MDDDLEHYKPELQTEVDGGGSGKPPRRTAVATETPEPESKPRSLMHRFWAWLVSFLWGGTPEITDLDEHNLPVTCDPSDKR